MTENEIIEYLKENKNKGIVYRFLPKEVRKWCSSHIKDLMYFDSFYKQFLFINHNIITHDICEDDIVMDVIALPKEYVLKQENKIETGWVDFDIDKNGCYRIFDTDMRFHWSEWNKPLWIYEKDENRSWYLTAFGGWQYKNCKAWFTQPMLLQGDHHIDCEFENETCKVEPDIPIKIRFWKISK